MRLQLNVEFTREKLIHFPEFEKSLYDYKYRLMKYFGHEEVKK